MLDIWFNLAIIKASIQAPVHTPEIKKYINIKGVIIMRVQFSINDAQWKQLQSKAQQNGYPDVPSYCKDLALEVRTYGQLWEAVVNKISNMKPGDTFVLRDLVDTPPANLGVKLYESQKLLKIEILPKKDNLKTNKYKKL